MFCESFHEVHYISLGQYVSGGLSTITSHTFDAHFSLKTKQGKQIKKTQEGRESSLNRACHIKITKLQYEDQTVKIHEDFSKGRCKHFPGL